MLITCLTTIGFAALVEGERPRVIPVTLQAHWVELPVSASGPPALTTGVTYSALKVVSNPRPVADPAVDPVPEIDPTRIHRKFVLEKTEFLLGEPILVEFRADCEAKGSWKEAIGGNNRQRGRDDNYLFLMREDDGQWMVDPQEIPDSMFGGGLFNYYEFNKDNPLSRWFAVQRWCRISRPGTYDLYCIHDNQYLEIGRRRAIAAALPEELKKEHYRLHDSGILFDPESGLPSERYRLDVRFQLDPKISPLMKRIPRDVAERISKVETTERDVADLAHYRVVIKQGSEAERHRMIGRWTAIAEADPKKTRVAAAREAIAFSPQNDFIPLLVRCVAEQNRDYEKKRAGALAGLAPFAYDQTMLKGIAANPDPRATALVLSVEPWQALLAMGRLNRERVADAIPTLIKWLANENREVRDWSYDLLRDWTGQDLGAGSPEQLNLKWQSWWDKSKVGFKPKRDPVPRHVR